MPQAYTMMAYESVLTRTVYWTVLFAPDFTGARGPYTPGNLSHIRVKVSRSVRESGPYACDINVLENEFVYFSVADTVDESDNGTPATAPAVGVVVSKPTTTSCLLVHEGEVDGFSSLTAGAVYYLGANGGITATPPTTAGNVVQRLGVAINSTTLLLAISEHTLL